MDQHVGDAFALELHSHIQLAQPTQVYPARSHVMLHSQSCLQPPRCCRRSFFERSQFVRLFQVQQRCAIKNRYISEESCGRRRTQRFFWRRLVSPIRFAVDGHYGCVNDPLFTSCDTRDSVLLTRKRKRTKRRRCMHSFMVDTYAHSKWKPTRTHTRALSTVQAISRLPPISSCPHPFYPSYLPCHATPCATSGCVCTLE